MARELNRTNREQVTDEEQIVRTLARETEDSFLNYLHGEIEFDELTFELFDTLQAIHAVRTGGYTIEYVDDEEEATETQEELAQEPAREGPARASRGKKRRR